MKQPPAPSGTVHADRARPTRQAMWLGCAYFVIGALWIWLSDGAVEAVSRDPQWLVVAQRYKGLAYVCVTTVGLTWLAYLGHQRLLRMQARVVESDLRVADLFQRHPQPMWVFRADDLRIQRVNDAAVTQYGFSRDEFLTMTIGDLRSHDVPWADEGAASPHPQAAVATALERHRTKRGAAFWAKVKSHGVELDGMQALLAMSEDVTAERRLKEMLQQQERQFTQLLEGLGEVLWVGTPQGPTVKYVSPAFETIYGRPCHELYANARLWEQVIHPEDAERVRNVLVLGPDHDSVECDYRILRPDGSHRWVRDRKTLIRDDTGSVVLVGGIAEDITARKERDAAVRALNDRLEGLVAERTRELAKTNVELEAFSRTAAHDLKTPLNGIAGMSQLLRLRLAAHADEASRRYLDQIERSAADMARLISDLLAFSRAGNVELRREPVDLAPAANRLIEDLRQLEPWRNVEATVAPRIDVCCDEGLMRSVLQNLVTNAWKFTVWCDVARIQVEVGATEGCTVLTVRDNGVGFEAPASVESLRPFQRFHTQSQFQGTGLGLVTCQRIVERHGGRLDIASTPGVGTTVSVRLPERGSAKGVAAHDDRASTRLL